MLQRMLNRLRGANDDEKGFTLIELLVVVLIIGILAAIALPTFLGQSDKAKDSSAKSDARNAVTQMESCLTDGSSAEATTACAASDDVMQFGADTKVTGTGAGLYNVVATSESSNKFTILKAAPGYTYSCTEAGQGGCSAAWGEASTTPSPG